MIHTDNPEQQRDVDKANALIADWFHYIKRNREKHRGLSLRLYIDPRTWHDFIILEFGPYGANTHNVKMFGYDVQVYLVYGTDREHAYLTYVNGC